MKNLKFLANSGVILLSLLVLVLLVNISGIKAISTPFNCLFAVILVGFLVVSPVVLTFYAGYWMLRLKRWNEVSNLFSVAVLVFLLIIISLITAVLNVILYTYVLVPFIDTFVIWFNTNIFALFDPPTGDRSMPFVFSFAGFVSQWISFFVCHFK